MTPAANSLPGELAAAEYRRTADRFSGGTARPLQPPSIGSAGGMPPAACRGKCGFGVFASRAGGSSDPTASAAR